MSEIGENIRKLRESADMSQSQLASRIGKTRSTISQYESGKITPRMGVIERLSGIFNVPKSEIIGSTSSRDVERRSELHPISYEEEQLIRMFRSSTREGKAAIEATARAMSKL